MKRSRPARIVTNQASATGRAGTTGIARGAIGHLRNQTAGHRSTKRQRARWPSTAIWTNPIWTCSTMTFKHTLIAAYAAMLGVANIAAVKVVSMSGWEFTAGVIPIAVAFLVSDVLVERHGEETGHAAVWAGFTALLITVVIIQIVLYLPGESAVNDVFGMSFPLLLASLTTILLSQHTDVWLFAELKERLPYRPTRNIGSTIVSQGVDTAVFSLLAFAIFPAVVGGETLPFPTIATIIVTEWTIKSCIAVIDTPIFLLLTNDD